MALVLLTTQVGQKMLRDGSPSGRGFNHCLLVFGIGVAVHAHDRNVPALHHVATLVAVQLQYTSVFHG